jgi:hypothetical protein
MRASTLVQVAAMTIAFLSPLNQVRAQAPSQQGGTVRVGTLRCDVAGSTAFIFGSTREISCDFINVNGRRERYTGEISRYGVDLGFTRAAVMLWAVAAPTTDVQPGVLAGTFVGVSSGVTAGVGVGANVLVGGSNRSIALQPLSIEGNTGLNIALGVAELRLQAAQ